MKDTQNYYIWLAPPSPSPPDKYFYLPFPSLEQAVPNDFALLAKIPAEDTREVEGHKRRHYNCG